MEQSNVDQKEQKPTGRKFYRKPQLSRVQLVAREAVLGSGCKHDAILGPGANPCTLLGAPCQVAGS